MSYVNFRRSSRIAAFATALLLAGSLATVAEAGNGNNKRQKAHASQGAQGNWTRTTTAQRTPTGHTRNSVATRDDGRTATRNTTVVNDRAAGTRSVDSTATGFNGRTTSYSSDRQRTDDGYTREVSRTQADGDVRQRSIDVSCDKPAQTCVKTVTGNGGG